METVRPNLRSFKHKKHYETKFVTRTPSSRLSSWHFHNRLHWEHSSWKWQKLVQFWWPFVWKLQKCIFRKQALTLHGKQEWADAVKKILVIFKIGWFKLSENFKSVAQAVFEIFEEVYVWVGHNMPPPPPGWDRVQGWTLRVECDFV